MKTSFIAALVAAAVAFPVAAQAQNTYIGVSTGQAKQKVEVVAGSFKESDTSYKLYAGYHFDKHFGVEAGYVDLGTAESKGVVTLASKAKSFYVAATATLPLSPEFAVFAKAGVAANDVDVARKATGIYLSNSASEASAIFGLGASYSFAPNLALIAEYENFGKIAKGDRDNLTIKADMWSLGLRYKF
jgi:OOP family OmpA-OmpF porin